MGAVGNYEIVSLDTGLLTGDQSWSVDAPAGKVVLGGGYEVLAGSTPNVLKNGPSEDGSSWEFRTVYSGGAQGQPSLKLFATVAEMGGMA